MGGFRPAVPGAAVEGERWRPPPGCARRVGGRGGASGNSAACPLSRGERGGLSDIAGFGEMQSPYSAPLSLGRLRLGAQPYAGRCLGARAWGGGSRSGRGGETMDNCDRGRDELYDNVYRAVLMCKLAGLGFAETRRIVEEIFGAAIPRSVVKSWFYGRKRRRLSKLNALDKSLWYHEAYRQALKLKEEHPSRGHKKITTEIRKKLPIRVPPMTVYFWITGRSKPNITPIKICPELGYLVGILVGDRRRTGDGLKVKDREFIEYYACMYEKVTGIKPKIALDSNGYYNTRESGAFLRTLWRTGLWKVAAYIYPREFLQGLFDSDGSIIPQKYKNTIYGCKLTIVTGNPDTQKIIEKILHLLNYKSHTLKRRERTRIIKNKTYKFKPYYDIRIYLNKQQLNKFATEIGFREGIRRRKLAALLEALKHPPKERHEIYHKILTPSPNFAFLTLKIEKGGGPGGTRTPDPPQFGVGCQAGALPV